MATLKIFISYAKKDYNLMTAVEFCCKQIGQIDFAGKKYKVDVWSDHYLLPGEAWKKEIVERIKEADIVLFLLSPNFVKSDFILNTEIPLAMKRKEESGIGILGIYMEQCDFSHLSLRKHQLIPSYHGSLKAISTWSKSKTCWDAVKDGIEICAHASINNMPWNRGITQKLPPKLQEKNFVHNAPPALQHLRNMVVRAETRKKANAETKRREEEQDKLYAVLITALIAIIILLFYIKFFM
jgi:TIR domain